MKKYQRILLLILAGSIILFFQCAYYNTLFNAKKNYEEGLKKLSAESAISGKSKTASKYFQNTIEKCWKLIEIYGDNSKYADDALLYIIKSEYYLGQYTKAKLHATQFMRKYPESDLMPEAYLWYGKISIALEDVETGKDYLYKSINATKNSEIRAEAYYELGNLAYHNQDYEGAIDFFEKASKEKVSQQYAAFLQYYLGELYYDSGNYDEAIKRFKKVSKHAPSVDVEYKTKKLLAMSYVAKGKENEALGILRKMLTAPRFRKYIPFIKNEIAQIYNQLGELDKAVELYREILKENRSGTGPALASFNLAKLYEHQIQNIDSAVYYYGKVRKLDARFDSVKVAENKRVFLSELADIQEAIKHDSYLVYRLENDPFFRDSLYKAQFEDSIQQEIKKLMAESGGDTSLLAQQDSSKLMLLDSLKRLESDSLKRARGDSISKKIRADEREEEEAARSKLTDEERDRQKELERSFAQQPKTPKRSSKQKEPPKPKLERRKLPQIKEDLKKNKFHLAEYYLLKVENYDSARVHYEKFLKEYQDSVLTPKAIYSLYYIYSQPEYLDSLKLDSLSNVLIQNYPESEFTKVILRKKGVLTEEKKDALDELGHRLFLQAEKLVEQNELDSALVIYRQVADLDSTLVWSAKAQLAIGWIYEKMLHDTTKAIEAYRELKEKYPIPEYAQWAALRIATPQAQTVQKAEKEEAPEKKEITEEAPVITGQAAPSAYRSNPQKYLNWRRRRTQK